MTGTRWVQITKEAIKTNTVNVTDLNEGTEYEFRVSAENKAGTGEPSAPSKPFKAKDPWGE